MVWNDKMKKLKGVLVLVLLMALLASPVAVLASDVTGAKYYGLIQVSNNGTAVTNVATTCNISTANFINAGYLNSSANNCAIQSSSGADLPFQPSVNASYPWGLWVPAMGANTIKTDILYTANSTGGIIRYFPGAGGMTTSDNDTNFELGDNYTIEQSGWVDIDSGTDKNLVYKEGAFRTFVSPTASGNITTRIGDAAGEPSGDGVALDFVRATSDWVSIPDSPALGFTTGAFVDLPATIIVWAKLDDATSSTLLAKSTAAGVQEGWRLVTLAGDELVFHCLNPAAAEQIGRKTAAITAYEGLWVHYAMTYSATETSAGINLYINGVDADIADDEVLPYNGLGDTTAVLELGSYNAGTANNLDGTMAEAKIYTVELSPAQILADYNGTHRTDDLEAWYKLNEGTGNPTDSTANGHDATANTADWLVTVGVTATGVTEGEHIVRTTGELALDFVRANTDWVSIPDSMGLRFTDGAGNDEPFSMMVWANLDDATSSTLLAKFTAGGREWLFYLTGADKLSVDCYDIGGGNSISLASDAVMTGYQGSWTQFGSTYDGSNLNTGFSLYVNGLPEASTPGGAGVYPGMTSGGAVVEMGSYSAGTSTFLDGILAEVKIYTAELTPAQVLADYEGGHLATDLEAWYKLDEGAGLPADSTANGHDATANLADWVAGPLKIFIDDIMADIDVGIAIPNTGDDWVFMQSNVMPYMEYHTISIDGTQVQYIDWEYDTTFQDSSGFDNDATPTFRTASSDADVTAEFVSFLPIGEAQAPAYVLDEAVPFIEEVPVIVSEFAVTPPPGGFPLAGVIAAVATATDTPAQLPLVLIAGFVIIGLSLAISSIMRRYGSGTVLVKVIVIASLMGIFVGIGNFGIDFWMIFVFVIIGIALSMASRQLGWQ